MGAGAAEAMEKVPCSFQASFEMSLGTGQLRLAIAGAWVSGPQSSWPLAISDLWFLSLKAVTPP